MGGGGLGICSPESGAYLHAVEDRRRGPNALVAALALSAKKVAMRGGVEGREREKLELSHC